MKILSINNVRKYGMGAVASAALLGGTQANAAFDVTGALTGSSAESNIETGATWVLGVAVLIFSAKKVIAFFSR